MNETSEKHAESMVRELGTRELGIMEAIDVLEARLRDTRREMGRWVRRSPRPILKEWHESGKCNCRNPRAEGPGRCRYGDEISEGMAWGRISVSGGTWTVRPWLTPAGLSAPARAALSEAFHSWDHAGLDAQDCARCAEFVNDFAPLLTDIMAGDSA